VLIAHLPSEAVTARQLSKAATGWNVTEYLLADVYYALTGTPHPARPQPAEQSKAARYAELRQRLQAQRERHAAQNASA
jgi:hypothetical protein